MGTVYAITNSGGKLATWYESQFSKQTQVIAGTTIKELYSYLEQFNKDIVTLKETVSKKIGDYQADTIVTTKNTIKDHREQQLDQLHTTTEEIKSKHSETMEVYTEHKKQQETEQLTQDVEDILTDLTQK